MKPIAQTFLVSQPDTSLDGIFLTRIDVYFKSVSSKFGITMEIRTVENGFPTQNVVAGGKTRVDPVITRASDDATLFTSFVFDDLPFLQSNVQYAFVLIPDGGNDEYLVWAAKLSEKDVTTGSPIYTNNQLGNMFISSNDLVWTPLTLESMKYNMYIANFLTNSGEAVFRPVPTEYITVNKIVSNFKNKEAVWVSNSMYMYAQTTANSTSVTVVNTSISDLAVNNWIYIATADRARVNFRQVDAIVNSTVITVSSNTTFTNSTCIYGRIAGDGALYATIKSQDQYFPQEDIELVLINNNANSTLNLSTSANQFIFGLGTKASAVITAVANKPYDSITPHINFISPAQTAIDFAYRGYSNANVQDSSYITADDNLPNEFVDFERRSHSRSNEAATLGSNPSLTIKAKMSTLNKLTAPHIDHLGTMVTLTYNSTAAQTQLMGYHLNLADVSGKFNRGDVITQGSNTATVDDANSSYIRVISASGKLTNTAISAGAVTANVTAATYFDETMENGYYGASRYISKNVVLADKQDAEDIVSFLTVHRPVGTQFNVYGRFLNGSDTEPFNSKDWSHMVEADATTPLFSSASNRDDLVEIQFGLPASQLVDNVDAVANSTIANVTVGDTTYYDANTYIYLKDNVSNTFNVRKVKSIPTRTILTLETNPSFSSTNTCVGNIPGLQSQSGAFTYANNNGIIRYVTSTDVVYDSYKTFAVKIVPISNNSVLVPVMKNMRCIALQI